MSATPLTDARHCNCLNCANNLVPITDAAYRQLLDLLAILHRDGGHHTAAVGLAESIKGAITAITANRK